MSLVALSLVPAGKDWAQQDGYKAVSVPALHGLFAEWFCECTWGHSFFFFFCLYILFSETQSGKIKKKKERWRIFGGYFAGRFLGDELACGDV